MKHVFGKLKVLGTVPVTALGTVLITVATGANGSELERIEVGQGIYAIVGPLEQRSEANLGNNATFGFVVTDEGVLLIDSGGTEKGARALEALVREVTDAPITLVVNTGGQDHRWFGNNYFAEKGAKVISARVTAEDQLARQSSQMQAMQALTANAWVGTSPQIAEVLIENRLDLKLGNKQFSIIPVGQTHTANESLVWLPDDGVLFSGDVVYMDRMLRVGDHSAHKSWIDAFEVIDELAPDVVVPGHGYPAPSDKAKRDTLNYLVYLREAVGEIIEEGGEMQSVSQIDQSQFNYLAEYEALHGVNVQRVFEEMEWE